ncbi:hypothetical protein H2200_008188 [Cladophialophora chaetospira]|uniref:Fumarylacetoacetase-like C-terminal domain-containing protein n=1 Tax=Cladophialophora chaetospira TaxID=386627 RepID=A0AA38X5S5_9EURO|nr:hypothetical protein H2200_008188 [Cladophialophora chaetospira]
MLNPKWESIIRFKCPDGEVHYGEPTADLKSARVWTGLDVWSLQPTDTTRHVAEILAPYEPTTIIGIGCNYKGHAHETGIPLPNHPIIFRKLPSSITSPTSLVELHGGDVDYENELCFITSQPARNVLQDNALNYILGFTVGNDISSRYWQRKDTSGGQACYAKSFDGFCPIGPKIVSAKALQNFQSLRITTRRDGEVVQNSNTSDMLFGVRQLMAFLTRGTTLPAGTLVLTGTPPGVGSYQTPPRFIKAGEVLECEIEGIGKIQTEFTEVNSKAA